MILYVVTYTYWDSTTLIGVFSTEDLANEAITKDRHSKHNYQYDIQEVTLDKSEYE